MRFLFSFCYDCLVHLYLLCVAIPKMVFHWKKYRGTLWSRLGYRFPSINKGERPLIWIHAVSLGETKAILPLIAHLKQDPSAPLLLLSTMTKTGYEVGEGSGVDWHTYLPFDLPYVISHLVKRVKPDLVVLVETDFWYHFLQAAKGSGARLAVVNGKLSERSFRRYRRIPLAVESLLMPIDLFCLQGEVYAERFRRLGIPESRLVVTGNLKIEGGEGEKQRLTREEIGITPDQYLLTLGSTHDPEERLWIEAIAQIEKAHPEVRVLLVPRHPERFDQVAALLERQGVSFTRWSQGSHFGSSRWMLMDCMGMLRSCYQISDIAFVGGTFTPEVGGHNLIEPALFGKAVLYGPYTQGQPHLHALVEEYQAGLQLAPEEIVATLLRLIEHPEESQERGAQGAKLVAHAQGALNKTRAHILRLLEKAPS